MGKLGVRWRWVGAAMGMALLVLARPAAAQAGRVLGRVTDGIGNPVAHAQVTLVAADSARAARTAVTGETGGFEFGAVPPGRYTVRAAAPGFRDRELRVELQPAEVETVIARLITVRGVPRPASERRPSAPPHP
jgi:protocatechuate 3,4-dioxygenase beta subunit